MEMFSVVPSYLIDEETLYPARVRSSVATLVAKQFDTLAPSDCSIVPPQTGVFFLIVRLLDIGKTRKQEL
jgi:hypothetical protein